MSKRLAERHERQVEQFLDRLFMNGAGERASRLILWRDASSRADIGEDLGGYCRDAVKGLVRELLSSVNP